MVVLIINRSNSICGGCNKSTSPHTKIHETILGYSENGQPGCGAEFTAVATHYAGLPMEEAVKNMRPDLPYLSWFDLER